MRQKTHRIIVRIDEDEYRWLKSFEPMTISDVIRRMIDGYMILERMPFFEAVMPLDQLKEKFRTLVKEQEK